MLSGQNVTSSKPRFELFDLDNLQARTNRAILFWKDIKPVHQGEVKYAKHDSSPYFRPK